MVNGFINTLVAFLVGGATLSFNFKAVDSAGAVICESNGTVISVGENYRMETDDVIIVSDGTVKGIYQKAIDEIVRQPVGVPSADFTGMMDNPFAFLKDASKYYEVTTWKSGKKVSSGAKDELPDKIELRAKSGVLYTIWILSGNKYDKPDSSLFVLRLEDYPSAVVTDL